MFKRWEKQNTTLRITFHYVTFQYEPGEPFSITFKRGSHNDKTKFVDIGKDNKIIFEEAFNIPCTMFVKEGKIKKKDLKVTLMVGNKAVAKIQLDVGEFYGESVNRRISVAMEISGRGSAPILQASFKFYAEGESVPEPGVQSAPSTPPSSGRDSAKIEVRPIRVGVSRSIFASTRSGPQSLNNLKTASHVMSDMVFNVFTKDWAFPTPEFDSGICYPPSVFPITSTLIHTAAFRSDIKINFDRFVNDIVADLKQNVPFQNNQERFLACLCIFLIIIQHDFPKDPAKIDQWEQLFGPLIQELFLDFIDMIMCYAAQVTERFSSGEFDQSRLLSDINSVFASMKYQLPFNPQAQESIFPALVRVLDGDWVNSIADHPENITPANAEKWDTFLKAMEHEYIPMPFCSQLFAVIKRAEELADNPALFNEICPSLRAEEVLYFLVKRVPQVDATKFVSHFELRGYIELPAVCTDHPLDLGELKKVFNTKGWGKVGIDDGALRDFQYFNEFLEK